MKYSKYIIPCLFVFALYFLPDIASAAGATGVERSLSNIQTKLTRGLLPLLATIGLCFSAFSFVMGNPNARTHFVLATFGAAVGFGSSSIIELIKSLIN